MESSVPPSVDALLQERHWLRSLARNLVHDPERADDLVQRTYLAALRGGPTGPRVRGWLATVLRNCARQEARSQARRDQRERVSARPEDVPTPASLVQRVEAQTEVARAVLRLREPYREALLLRYYEALGPKKIADRLGIPARTVESRLRRALAILRRDLDLRHGGDRTGWLPGALALAKPVASGWSMGTRAAAAALLLATGGFLAQQSLSSPTVPARQTQVNAGPTASTHEPSSPAFDANPQRVSIPGNPSPEDRQERQELQVVTAEQGLPLAQRALSLESLTGQRRTLELQTDADGRASFRVHTGESEWRVNASATERTAGLSGRFRQGEPWRVEVPRRGGLLEGIVLDEQGLPYAGADVLLWFGVRPFSMQPDRSLATDGSGQFRFEDLAGDWQRDRRSFLLCAEAPGRGPLNYASGNLGASGHARNLTLQLVAARRLEGVVLGPTDLPVPNVKVNAIKYDRDPKPAQRKSNVIVKGLGSVKQDGIAGKSTPPFETGPDGKFVLRSFRSKFRLLATSDSYPTWSQEFDSGTSAVTIRLDAGVALYGRVHFPKVGNPAELRVQVLGGGEQRYFKGIEPDGSFRFPGFSPSDRLMVGFVVPGCAMHLEDPWVLEAGGPPLVVRLRPERRLTGTVRDTDGKPLHRIRIEARGSRWLSQTTYGALRTWEDQLLPQVYTDHLGAFQLPSLYSDTFLVKAYRPMEQLPCAAAVAELGLERIELIVGEGLNQLVTLHGQVSLDATGRPPERFLVQATSLSDQAGRTQGQARSFSFQDGTGRFEIPGLDPGRWRIRFLSNLQSFDIEREFGAGSHLLTPRLQ